MGSKFSSEITLWHPKVHEVWGLEQLYFWILHFSPVFERTSIYTAIQDLLRKAEIRSYAAYETAGTWDIFLRVWLPTSMSPEEFSKELVRSLGSVNLFNYDKLRILSIVESWLWNSDEVPAENELSSPQSDDRIQRANEHSLDEHEIVTLEKKRLIKRCLAESGIRFIVLVSQRLEGAFPLQHKVIDKLSEELKKILNRANLICDKSLYHCEGALGQFLITGRVKPDNFEAVDDQLLVTINSLQLVSVLSVRTYTYFVHRGPFIHALFQEHLSTRNQVAREEMSESKIEDILSEQESLQLEFKATAFTNLAKYFKAGTKSEEMTVKGVNLKEGVFTEGVLKAVVGMLNAVGGTLIVGIAIVADYSDEFIREKLADCPKYQDKILLGCDIDYDQRGWDRFQLRLMERLNAHIRPSPRPWLNVGRKVIEGKDLCVLTIRKNTEDWFYIANDARFLVRTPGQTLELEGPESDQYKKINQRS